MVQNSAAAFCRQLHYLHAAPNDGGGGGPPDEDLDATATCRHTALMGRRRRNPEAHLVLPGLLQPEEAGEVGGVPLVLPLATALGARHRASKDLYIAAPRPADHQPVALQQLQQWLEDAGPKQPARMTCNLPCACATLIGCG